MNQNNCIAQAPLAQDEPGPCRTRAVAAIMIDGTRFPLTPDHDEELAARAIAALRAGTVVAFDLDPLRTSGYPAGAVVDILEDLRTGVTWHRADLVPTLEAALGVLDKEFRAPLRGYVADGFAIARVAPGEKAPTALNWSVRSCPVEDFAPGDGVALVLGPISGGHGHALVCVDLDFTDAVARADEFLIPTDMVEGRAGKLRSHRYYRVPLDSIPTGHESSADRAGTHARSTFGHPGPATRHFRRGDGTPILDLLGTGSATVCPPSLHPSGEYRAWNGGRPGEPAVVGYWRLFETVSALANACGWPGFRHEGRGRTPEPICPASACAQNVERARRYLRAIVKSGDLSRSGAGGHNTFFGHLCALAEGFAVTDPVQLRHLADEYNGALRERAGTHPGQGYDPWSDAEIEHKIGSVLAQVAGSDRLGYLLGEGNMDEQAAPRPTIWLGPDEFRVNDEAGAALAAALDTYQRGGTLVRVVRGDHGYEIRGFTQPTLRETLTRHADFFRVSGNKEVAAASPPAWCVSALLERGWWDGVRHLRGLAPHPLFRPDGTVLNRLGYDSVTGLFVTTETTLQVPRSPTRADACRAAASLLEVVADFPFARDADRSAWVALVLTRLARHAIVGPTPLFLVNGNAPGVGKGLLSAAAHAVVTGEREPRAMGYVHGNDAELAKKINSLAMAGYPLVQFGNVSGEFGSPQLDEAITSMRWGDRVLGSNRFSDADLGGVVWAANGNNVELVGDTPRRVLRIDLVSTDERPEFRHLFQHPDLIEWVLRERPRLLSAALMVLVAYHAAGRPLVPFAAGIGSFERWSALVRSAVAWAGLPDPAECLASRRVTVSPEELAAATVVVHWDAVTGGQARTVADVLELVRRSGTGSWCPATVELAAALRQLSPDLSARSLGRVLARYENRVFQGHRLVRDGATGGAIRWRCEAVPAAAVAQTAPVSQLATPTTGVGTPGAEPREATSNRAVGAVALGCSTRT